MTLNERDNDMDRQSKVGGEGESVKGEGLEELQN